VNDLTAVGHRVVHGGPEFRSATLVDDSVIQEIEALSRFAPLHNPANLIGLRECRRRLPTVPQVAVFDTSFHLTVPPRAHLYALPPELCEPAGIRRYGFHGISHHHAALRAAAHLRAPLTSLRMITCHLGAGASLCAIDHGRSVDTSMGLTPLEGIPMPTRSGSLDPALPLWLIRERGMSPDEAERYLNEQCGVIGLSGVEGSMLDVLRAADEGNAQALRAVELFCYHVRKCIGAYVAALGGLDVLVFTGGVAEGDPGVRARACQALTPMGVNVDPARNIAAGAVQHDVTDISAAEAAAKVLVVPADEQWMIAAETMSALGREDVTAAVRPKRNPILIGVSACHVHLCERDVWALFGQGHQLTFRTPLRQPGQYACEEHVNLIGPRGMVERVRVLGPVREETQVEIGRTEEFRLGTDAPLRCSGDLEGTPGVTLEGPAGQVELPRGLICARCHVHMSPLDALSFGVRDGDTIVVKVPGERPIVFSDVLVRVDPSLRLEMHINTDEASAAEVSEGSVAYLERIQSRASD